MATLNTLRTRGGIIVTIVIGLALIAFLLGDLFAGGTGWMQTRKMKVGEIDGKTIGYIEYANRLDYATRVIQALRGDVSSDVQDQARELSWEQLLMQYAYMPGLETLGLVVGEEEKADMVSGAFLSPVITQTFANPNTGMFDPMFLHNFIQNIDNDPSGNAALMWDYIKEQMVQQRAMGKLMELLARGMYVTDLEVNQGVYLANNVYDAGVLVQEYLAVPDTAVTVSQADIRAFYNEHKQMFRQGASREIEYVVFHMQPSEQDFAEARKQVEELAAEFAGAADPMQYARLNSQETPDQRYFRESELEPAMAALAFGNPATRPQLYGPSLNGTTYTIARLASVRSLPDSVGLSAIMLDKASRPLADSLFRVLKAGKGNFAQLAMQYSMDPQSRGNGGAMGVFPPEALPEDLADRVLNATAGDIFTYETDQGVSIFQLTLKTKPQPKAQIARITYHVEPSPFTQQTIYGNASAFLTAAAGSVEKFNAAVSEFAVARRTARIRNTDRNVQGLDNSHELVRWAFVSGRGAVSTIMEAGGDYVVALLTGVNEEGIAPIEKVTSDIRTILTARKKGDLLAARFQGASLEEVAAKLGTSVIPVGGLQFESFYVDGVGAEPRLVGAVCGGVSPQTLSRPVHGNTGVFLFEVSQVTVQENATPESQRVRIAAMAQSYLNERAEQALREESKAKDWRVKYF